MSDDSPLSLPLAFCLHAALVSHGLEAAALLVGLSGDEEEGKEGEEYEDWGVLDPVLLDSRPPVWQKARISTRRELLMALITWGEDPPPLLVLRGAVVRCLAQSEGLPTGRLGTVGFP